MTTGVAAGMEGAATVGRPWGDHNRGSDTGVGRTVATGRLQGECDQKEMVTLGVTTGMERMLPTGRP